MAIVIKWADEAKKTFDENISYLMEEWTEKEIKNFVKQTKKYIIKNSLHTRRCIQHPQKIPK